MSSTLTDTDSIGIRTTAVGVLVAVLLVGLTAAFAGGVAADTSDDGDAVTTISTGAMPGDTIEERSEQRMLTAGVAVDDGDAEAQTMADLTPEERMLLAGVEVGSDDAVTTISTGAMPGDTIEERSEQRQLLAGATNSTE